MIKSLLNMKVRVLPDLDLGQISGYIVLTKEADREAIIIKLITPFDYNNDHYEYLIASPRQKPLAGHSIASVKKNNCSLKYQ